MLLAKTTRARLEEIEAAIRSRHPYDPEIVALPVVGGAADYLAWIRSEVG